MGAHGEGPEDLSGARIPCAGSGCLVTACGHPLLLASSSRSSAASSLLVHTHHPPSLTSAVSCVLGPPELGGAQPYVRRRGRCPAALGTVSFPCGRVSMLYRARAVCPTEAYHLWPHGLCSWSQCAAQQGRRQRLAAEIPG